MAITPNDQVSQFDRNPGRGESLLRALAVPSATAVAAETAGDNVTKNGSDGTKAYTGGPAAVAGATNTARPKSSSNWIAGGAVGGYGTVTAGTNPAPKPNKHVDAIRNQNDTASVAGPGSPVVTAGATGGTSPTATQVLNWTAVPTAASYRVEKSVKSGAVWGAWVAGVPPTAAGVTVTETGLSTGQVRFRVFTVGPTEESPPSNAVTVTIP